MGPIDCPETSVTNYHYSLHNRPEGAQFSAAVSDVRSVASTAICCIDFAAGIFGFGLRKSGPSEDKKVRVLGIGCACGGNWVCVWWELGVRVVGIINCLIMHNEMY
jgi:hypothetical protein